ncbi:hypothetical protein K474DRAFT_1708667 [Panus rudis PR-1116 ss-1]|nr:hypothetical protein K474DRAFT_1708667 [Panus rudis PR-1116 ss-1]
MSSSVASHSGLPTPPRSSRVRSERGSFPHTSSKTPQGSQGSPSPGPSRVQTPVPRGHAPQSGRASPLHLRGNLHRPGSPSSPLNEAPGLHDARLHHSRFQTAHQHRQHASASQIAQRGTQVPPSPSRSPLSASPAFSLSSLPATPHRRRVSARKLNFPQLDLSESAASSVTSSGISPRLGSPFTGNSSTHSSPKARSHSITPSRSSSSSTVLIRRGLLPKPAPPTLAMSIQVHAPSPILSTRPVSPTPSQRPGSRSRPSSPSIPNLQLPSLRPPMARPPSRSEKLLRDTLRRAEEHERLASLAALPSPSIFGATQPAHGFVPATSPSRRHHRRDTASSTGTDASLEGSDYFKRDAYSHEEEQDAEEGGWLWRTRSATSASSSGSSQQHLAHGHTHGQHSPRMPGNAAEQGRSSSTAVPPPRVGNRSRAHTDPVGTLEISSPPYASPTSPQRTQLHRSAKSAPNVSRSSTSRQSVDHDALPHSPSHVAPNPVHCGCPSLTPHEAVLRSRLEGVLRGAKETERRTKSREREMTSSSSGSGTTSNSMASSRNLSVEGDWFFGPEGESYTSSPTTAASEYASSTTTTTTRKRGGSSSAQLPPHYTLPLPPTPMTTSHPHPPRTPSMKRHHRRSETLQSAPSSATLPPQRTRGSSTNGRGHPNNLQSQGPLTPPPTPPTSATSFNARTAAEQCKAMDGYVSFAQIEGLGVPPGLEEDGDDGEGGNVSRASKWLKWLSLGGHLNGVNANAAAGASGNGSGSGAPASR